MNSMSFDEEKGEAGGAVEVVHSDSSLPCTPTTKSTSGKLSTSPKIAQSNKLKVQVDLELRHLFYYVAGF